MQILKTITLKILAISMFVISTLLPTNAQEINNEYFSGAINSSVSSGVSFRTERDCSNLDGFSFTSVLGTYVDGSGKGCGTALTDAYGNTTDKVLSRNSGQADDGSMNYDKGDIFSTTQKLTSQIVGTLSSGVGVNLSFTGFIDPNVSTSDYAPLTETSKKLMERGLSLLDAYVTTETELPSGEYIDWTIGRQVTNWGEATFIPVGMNGLTTNALDLSKLRRPGSSIREALMPTEQITMSTYLGEGINLEAFYQFNDESVQLDAAGSFFGNEVVAPGSNKYITSANYKYELRGPESCPYSLTSDDEDLCNAALEATAKTDAGIIANDKSYLFTTGLMGLTQSQLATASAAGATKVWGTNLDGSTTDLTTMGAAVWNDAYTATLNALLGSATDDGVLAGGGVKKAGGVDKTFFAQNTVGYELATNAGTLTTSYIGLGDTTGASLYAAMQALDADSLVQDVNDTYATVAIRRADDFIKEARSDGQFGLKMSGYSDAGTGVDWSLNYSRFHSKAPYVRVIGKGGVYAGDMYGILTSSRATAAESRTAAQATIVKALSNVAYGGGVCNAKLSAPSASATFAGADTTGAFFNAAQAADATSYDGTVGAYTAYNMSSQQKALHDQYTWQQTVNGQLVHNSAKCYDSATALTEVMTTQKNAGMIDTAVDYHEEMQKGAEILLAALTPLNSAKYELIYPEDLNALGASFNTNINGTTVQGELTYRPNFPLATNGGDQVNQIGDVSGAFDMLDLFVYQTVAQLGNSNTSNDSVAIAAVGDTVSPNFYSAAAEATMTATQIAQQRVRMYMIGRATVDASSGVITVSADTTIPNHAPSLANYQNWQGSQNSGHTSVLGLANVRKGIFDVAYVASCSAFEDAEVCRRETLGTGDYNSLYYTGAAANPVGGAYEFGMLAFNRSSLPAIAQTATTGDYYSTPFIEKDVYSFDLGTTTLFNASHPINTALGSDSSVFLTEVAVVHINGMNNAADGYISRGGYQEGIGNEKCLGAFGGLVGSGYTLGASAAITHLGAGIVDGLFGNGKYCEDQSGADETSLSYRLIGSATYNNFNNSAWSVTPSVVWSHDAMGYGPSSLGGFVEDRMSMSLGLRANKGASLSASVNYSSNLAGPEVDTSSDRDFVSMSMSYSF